MSKKIVVINAGPRKGWNTDTLITEAAKGAQSMGAEIIRFDLFRLEKYTGCISCFGCKHNQNKGRCVCRDGLTPVLDAIREADGLIIGSPNYLSEMTASFRALYERLIFQNLTYNMETPCCNLNEIPVLFIMTSNAPDSMYTALVQNYQQTLTRFVGPTNVLVSGDTLQLKDYSKTDWPWTMFDAEAKLKRRETVFPEEIKKAFAMGAAMVRIMIGDIVTVTVDRPLGSYHPKYKDMYYPINYGYIEGIIAPDGEEQDAYILGVDKPVERFTGKIIAIVHRYDDVEEKWVVCPTDASFNKEEIMELIRFQEQYYQSEIIM